MSSAYIRAYIRGGSRISEKGVHLYKCVGVSFADFIQSFLNIQWKWNNLVSLVSLRPNYFLFIGYLKMWGGEGVRANHLNPLWICHCISFANIWTQIRPDILSDLIWIQTVDTLMVILSKIYFEKNLQTTKKYAKITQHAKKKNGF